MQLTSSGWLLVGPVVVEAVVALALEPLHLLLRRACGHAAWLVTGMSEGGVAGGAAGGASGARQRGEPRRRARSAEHLLAHRGARRTEARSEAPRLRRQAIGTGANAGHPGQSDA